MRKLVTILALMFTATIFAQEVKPTFEKAEGQIKGTFYYEDGAIRQQGFYNTKGKLHGEWKSYDASGKKIAMGRYSNGVKTGKWFFWSEDKLSEVNYENNSVVDVTKWSNKDNVAVNYKD